MKKSISILLILSFIFTSVSFASFDPYDPLISTRGYTVTAEEFFGEGWRMTRSPIVKDKDFGTLTPTEQIIRSTVLYVVGQIPFMDAAILT